MSLLAPATISELASSIEPIVNDMPGSIATSGGLITRISPSLAASATNQVASMVINVAESVGRIGVERRERPPQQDHRADHQPQERVPRERGPGRIDDHPEADGGDGVGDDGDDVAEAWLHRAGGLDLRDRIGGSDGADGCEIGDVVDAPRQVELEGRPVRHLDLVADGTDLDHQCRRQRHDTDLVARVVGADVDQPPRDQLGRLFDLEQRDAQLSEHRGHFRVIVRIGIRRSPPASPCAAIATHAVLCRSALRSQPLIVVYGRAEAAGDVSRTRAPRCGVRLSSKKCG